MPEDLFVSVEKVTVASQQVGVTMKELSILSATPGVPGVIAVVLAAKDAAGEWRTDTQPLLVRKIDDLESENPSERYAASMFHELMFSAIVADTPIHQAMGIAGLTVWDAAKAILGQELQ